MNKPYVPFTKRECFEHIGLNEYAATSFWQEMYLHDDYQPEEITQAIADELSRAEIKKAGPGFQATCYRENTAAFKARIRLLADHLHLIPDELPEERKVIRLFR